MTIRIITDSTSEISIAKAKELNIDVVPLSITFNQQTYKDQIELTVDEFYEKLEECETLPTTSQPSPSDFLDVFNKYPGDTIIGIFLSSKVSGTLQSANIAKNMMKNNDNIYLIDSMNATGAMAILIYEAVKMRDNAVDAEAIVKKIEELAPRVRLVAYVDTIKYFIMGGRISGVKALLANSLSISPIIGLIDGEVVSYSKVRGKKKAYNYFIEFIENNPMDTEYCVAFVNAKCPEDTDVLIEKITATHDINYFIGDLGPVIGTHAGPKAFGIAYIIKESE